MIIINIIIITVWFLTLYFVHICKRLLTFRCDVRICFSATDALKGEGLQEGVDWLQGKLGNSVDQWKSVFNFGTTAWDKDSERMPDIHKQVGDQFTQVTFRCNTTLVYIQFILK